MFFSSCDSVVREILEFIEAGDVLWIFGEKVAGGPELRSFPAEALKLLPLPQEGLSFLLTFSVAHTHQGEKAQDPTGFPSQIPLM